MNVMSILTAIATDHENSLKGIAIEEDESSVISNDSFCDERIQHDFSADDRWFVICSRPQGNVSLIPTLFSIAGFVCCTIGNNLCSLFIRKNSSSRHGVVEDIAGVTLGLYSWGVEYYHEGVDEYVLTCSPKFPEGLDNDVDIHVARAFSVLATVIGLPTMCFLCLPNCMVFRRTTFLRTTVLLFFVSCLNAMVFLFLRSDRCRGDIFPELSGVVLESCSMSHGSKLSMIGSIMWFCASVFTAYFERASMVEEHIKMVAMRTTAR